jgi:hypothetical protein
MLARLFLSGLMFALLLSPAPLADKIYISTNPPRGDR